MADESKIEELTSNLKEYARIQYEIVQLKVIESLSSVGSVVVSHVFTAIILLCVLFSATLGAGFYLATLFEDYHTGFFIISLVYLLALIVFLFIKRKAVFEPVKDRIIRALMKDYDF
jgi:hypothetical protein